MTETEPKKIPWVLPDETRDHLKAARKEFQLGMEGLLPPKFLEHRRRARKEVLLAARSLIDHVIERIEEPPTA